MLIIGGNYAECEQKQQNLQVRELTARVGHALLQLRRNGGGKQVNPDLRNLIALQDLELKIAGLQKQASDIPNINQRLENELQQVKAEHQARVARLKDLANEKRALEGQVDVIRTKLSRLKDQLMSVKTNKEYTAMLHEIQTAEEQIRHEEDRILEVMERVELEEKTIKESEQQMLKRSAELQESIRKSTESQPQIEAELAKLREEKVSMESRIGQDLLTRYRRIADARKGVALAEARDELCSACHVRIRPQMYAELMRTETIHACDSCSRILFSRDNL